MSLNFYHPVSENPVEVIKDGVGTYSTIIQKQEAKVWPFLDKSEVFYPLWDEIADRYNPVHKQHLELVDDILKERMSKPSEIKTPKNKKTDRVS
jgi:hypothetical protein